MAPGLPEGLPGIEVEGPRLRTLEPGDLVSVEANSVPPIVHEGLIVDGRGRVHVPGIGDVVVGGQSTGTAQRQIEHALRRTDRLGEVFVRVTEPGGHRMTVLGAVATQGSIEVVPGMKLADALAAAGGVATPVEGARGQPPNVPDVEDAHLVRDGTRLPVDLARAIEGDPRHNVRVRPRDHLFVPWRSATVSVLGQVEGPTVMRHRAGLHMMEAIAVAGGITTGGDKSDVRLIRGSTEQPLVYRADVAAIVGARHPDIELLPGDVLFVTDDPLEDFGEVIAVVGPTLGLVLGITVIALTL